MACDGDFGDIEKNKKKRESIYTVQQYEEIMLSSKPKKNQPVIVHMKAEDFLDFTKGINFKNLNAPIDSDGKKFSWLKIHEFRYEQNLFGFKFKYDLKDDYRTCLFGKNGSARSKRPIAPIYSEMPMLYPNGTKLKAPKVLDMMTLMDFVPPIYQQFYKSIIANHQKIVDDHKRKKKNNNDEEELDIIH